MGPQKSTTKTSLRNLNDVLGKATKAPPGSASHFLISIHLFQALSATERFYFVFPKDSKGTLPGQEKNACKAPPVISIFDDSSQEGSENCQDDEQFKARRDFLKSGLPESFKKQLAKAAATKETYTLSCASFQPVVHMMQIPNGKDNIFFFFLSSLNVSHPIHLCFVQWQMVLFGVYPGPSLPNSAVSMSFASKRLTPIYL